MSKNSMLEIITSHHSKQRTAVVSEKWRATYYFTPMSPSELKALSKAAGGDETAMAVRTFIEKATDEAGERYFDDEATTYTALMNGSDALEVARVIGEAYPAGGGASEVKND